MLSKGKNRKDKIGSYEAKTHFSALLVAVAKGQKFIITKNDEPVAVLSPYEPQKKQSAIEAVQAMQAFGKHLHLGGLSIQEMKEEGRK